MSSIRLPQSPGIGGLNELTTLEETLVQNLASLDYAAGSLIYHNGISFISLPIGTATYVLAVNSEATAPEWVPPGSGTPGSGDVVGPAGAVNGNLVSFNTGTGKLIQDSGYKASDFALALGADDNYVTDAEKIKLSNLSGVNTGDQTLPVKASGSEVDTGTDDAKFVTAKAVSDSTITTSSKSQTLTNKRVTPRITTITSSATPTINTDNCDAVSITALAEAITSMTTNLSGTPTNFQKLIFRIKDDGTARAITWGSSFVAMGVALPTTTTISKITTIGFIYDTVLSKWGCVASVTES